MAAGLLAISSFTPARDRQGRLVAGARMDCFLNRTTTRATVYADAGLTTPLTNPVIANSSGQFPAVWAQAGTTEAPVLYSLAYSGATGESINNPSAFDDIQPSVSLDLVSGATKADVTGSNIPDGDAFREAIGADKGENVSQAGTAAQAQAAPALSLARAGRQVVDVLRRVPDLALARAGAFDIAPYVRAEMQDWGAAQYVISDAGTLQWNSMVDLPSGAELRASNRDVRLRPGPGLGSASDLTGGCAIRIAQPQSGVRNIRWIGSQMGAAACVIIDAGGYSLNDTYVMECETVDVGAFCYDRGTGAGTAGVGRHFRTRVEDNVFRQLRGCPIRIRYGFGHLYYLRNVADFPGSNAPNQLSFDMDGAAMSALPDAGGLFFSMVMGGTASEGASQAQRGALFKNTGEITLETGSAGDGLGGVAFDFDTVRLLRPDKVLARYCNDVAVRFKDVDNIEGGDFDIVGRHGLPGAASNKDAVRLEGPCANFNINRIAADSATGHAFHRVDGSMPLISVTRLIGRNCARRMLQLSGGSGSFFAAAATSVNNNLTGVDATANYETTSVADKIANFQLPSGGLVAVTTPSAG